CSTSRMVLLRSCFRRRIRWNAPGSGLARRKGEAGLTRAGLRVLYEDTDVIAVDKPPGLLTDVADSAQAKERDSVKKRLHAYLKPRGREPQVCHRIDRDTSGVVLFATQERVGEALRDQFAKHEPERTYWLAVHGVPEPREGTWEDWMMWDKGRLLQRVVGPDVPGAMLARAHYRVVQAFADAAILEVRLDTGRRNQIRVHACERGHPLLGERLYLPRGFRPGRWALPRQALHARSVVFRHPVTGVTIKVEAPLPPDLEVLVRRLAQPPEPPRRERGGRHGR
ncbi:MAG TPA: RluA family pseudouridine synthase, partial [Myxococcota bacterium]|nr:RluA family pseudouridine synthase [Myxococcota bacterium]